MKKNNAIILLTMILLSFIGLTSCKNLPSASKNEKDLRSKIEKVSENKVELIQFEKMNALEENVFGVKYYTISYKGKIKYKEDGFLRITIGEDINILKIFKDKYKPNWLTVFHNIKQDEEKKIFGKMIYTKTENGWEVFNGDISITEYK